MRSIQWPLATLACFAMVLSPSFRAVADEPPAVAAPVAPAAATEQKPAAAIDLSYIPATAVGAVVLHPQQVLAGENAEWLPVEVITAAGLQNVGFDPTQIQEAIGVIAPPDMSPAKAPAPASHPREPEPGVGAILHFSQAYSRRDVVAKLEPMRPVVKQIDGKKFAMLQGPMPFGIYLPDDRTLVVGTDGFLQQMIAATAVDSDLTKLLKSTDCSGTATAVCSLDAMRNLIDQAMAHAPPVPPPFADFLKIPKLISSGVIKADLRTPSLFSATLALPRRQICGGIGAVDRRAIEMGRQALLVQIAHEPHADDPVQQAMQKYSIRMSGRMFSSLKPTRDGSDVKWSIAGANGPAANIAVIGILVSLLLPAVSAAREAARRNQSQTNLKQIGLCFANHDSAYRQFPARAIFSKEGKPLLSWRVKILPYLDEGALYKDFHLDEPWDSPHNKALIARMPETFALPGDDPAAGLTHYVAVVGKGLVFEGGKPLGAADFTDGLSNTIMAVEADKPVFWTKPDDLEVDLEKPFKGLGGIRPQGFNAVFGDCHIQMISDETQPETLRALFTRAGGEAINFRDIR